MDSPSKNDDERNERIQTYLKIKIPEIKDKLYFSVEDNKKIFVLHDPIIKVESDKSQKYEIDKIFEDDTPYYQIYDEITNNCIKDSLKGVYFTFIAYGDSTSEKNELILGKKDSDEYSNTKGMFPRLIEDYLKLKDSENISIKINYIAVNGNKIIDLYSINQLNSRTLSRINQNEILTKYSLDIKSNNEILKEITMANCNNIKDIFFLNNIISILSKLDEDTCHLLSWSHFSFIINIFNQSGELISKNTFIILAGNEKINTKITNPHSHNKNTIGNTKNRVDIAYTYEDILNNLKSNQLTENEAEDLLSQSKLVTVLSKTCFMERLGGKKIKRKFKIIGTIFPNTGVFTNVKDTLFFLFDCKKIVRNRPKLTAKEIENLKKLMQDEDDKKDDIIFNLESKLKTQQKEIAELNNRVNLKQEKIDLIIENYQKQVNCLVKEFGFHGDINILLSKNEYTKEAILANKIRNAPDNNRIKENRLKELEEKIEKLLQEKQKIIDLKIMKENDDTLSKIYDEIKESKIEEERKIRFQNENSKEIENLKKENENLIKEIEKYKEENDNKFQIIKNLPNIIETNIQNYDKKEEENEKLKSKLTKHYQKEISVKGKKNKIEKEELKEKYEILLKEKEEELKKKGEMLEDISKKILLDKGSYIDEIVRLNDTFDDIISTYKICFDQRKFGTNVNNINNYNIFLKLKSDFDKTIDKDALSINKYQYPILYKTLNNDKVKVKRNSQYLFKDNEENKENILLLSKINSDEKEFKSHPKEYKIFKDLIKEDEEVETMDRDTLFEYIKPIKEKIDDLNDFNTKYINHKIGYSVKEFEINDNKINELYSKVDHYKKLLEEQTSKYKKSKMIIESDERTIEKLRNENFMLKKMIDKKNFQPFKTLNNFNSISPSKSKQTLKDIYLASDQNIKNSHRQFLDLSNKKGNTSYPTQVTVPSTNVTKQNQQNNKFNIKPYDSNLHRPMTSSNKNHINSYYRFQEPQPEN